MSNLSFGQSTREDLEVARRMAQAQIRSSAPKDSPIALAEIPGVLAQLQEAMSELDVRANTLIARLDQVSDMAPEETGKGDLCSSPHRGSDLGKQLQALIDHARAIKSRIDSAIGRLAI